MSKKIIMIAGPNGAGKTTFANVYLPKFSDIKHFLNADLIAKGMSPFDSEAYAVKAGRLMISEVSAHVKQGHSFAIETTLSGKNYAFKIPNWQSQGYEVTLIFLHISDVEISVGRVKSRVLTGGHNIPEAVIRRRYKAGKDNLDLIYKPIVNSWMVYDNTGIVPKLLAVGQNDY